MENQTEFNTSSLGLVAALTTYGIPYKDIKKVTNTKVEFIYDKTPELEAAKRAWGNGALMGPLSIYESNLKTVKGTIYGLLRPQE